MTKEFDNCEICKGAKGGVKGNENIVDNIVMCDYCTVEYQEEKKRLTQKMRIASKRKKNIIHIVVLLTFAVVSYGASFAWLFVTASNDITRDFKTVIQQRSEIQHQKQLDDMRLTAAFNDPSLIIYVPVMKMRAGDYLMYDESKHKFRIMHGKP